MDKTIVNTINLYVFYETSPAAVYGIGTYIRELTATLNDCNINVCVIYLRSNKPDMEMEESEGIRYWYIPASISVRNFRNNEERIERYYRNVLYLLQLYIVKKENLVFHLNHIHCKPLVDSLKSVFECKIVFVVHYLDSCIALLGKICRLRRIISQPDENMNSEERIVKIHFQREKELFQSVDKIICLANHTFDLLHQVYQIDKEKMVVISNGLSDVAVV